jgi:hypothetical protein
MADSKTWKPFVSISMRVQVSEHALCRTTVTGCWMDNVSLSELFGVSCLAWMSSPVYREIPGNWLWTGFDCFSRILSKASLYGRWPPKQVSRFGRDINLQDLDAKALQDYLMDSGLSGGGGRPFGHRIPDRSDCRRKTQRWMKTGAWHRTKRVKVS